MLSKTTMAESSGLLAKTELRAPISGRVAYLDAKVGEHAALGTVLVRIADESAWEVRSDDLTELSIARVHEGGRAILTLNVVAHFTFVANSRVEQAKRQRTFAVRRQ